MILFISKQSKRRNDRTDRCKIRGNGKIPKNPFFFETRLSLDLSVANFSLDRGRPLRCFSTTFAVHEIIHRARGKRRRFPLLLNRVPPPSRPRLISLLVQRRRGVREILSRILHSRLRVPETRPIRESLLVRRDDERVSPLMERWNEISRISSLVSLYSRPNYFVFHSRANPVNHDDCLTRGMAVWENRRTMGERLEWVNGRMNDERWRERVQIWISDRKCSSHPYFKN